MNTLPDVLSQQGYSIDSTGSLVNFGPYTRAHGYWTTLDGTFALDELEAIVAWMRAQPGMEDDKHKPTWP